VRRRVLTRHAASPWWKASFPAAAAISSRGSSNKPGASGTIAAAGVVRADADGYTMMIASPSTLVVVPKARTNPPYDAMRDMTPILKVASVPQVVVVPANSPFRTLGDLLAFARANPDKLNYASSGIGAAQHLAAELLSRAAGVRMTHVPYRGSGQAMSDLIAGQVDVNVDTLPSNLPHIRSGVMRALAVTTAERVEWLLEVPTVAESGFPGFERTLWYMIVAPAKLPAPLVDRWVAALNKALEHPETRQRIKEAGFMLGGGTATDAAALLSRETESTVTLLREANIRMD
jgi:tripartite-type tricarboxylate transporter receptor subunit TctC